MHNNTFRTILFLLITAQITVFAQQPMKLRLEQRGEIIVSFEAKYLNEIPNVGCWSIDKVIDNTAYVYLNSAQYEKILELNIPFIPEPIPSLRTVATMSNSVTQAQEWDTYPDYPTYLAMMNQFTIDYPHICKLDTIGYSVDGRLLLALKISDNVTEDEPEPEFFYTSSMHGDELTGYVLMLRLADYLLSNYQRDPVKSTSSYDVNNLVDNIEIYINPLANPDGTFKTGDHTVIGATRSNANNVDLNRNFPDPEDGEHPDGKDWQIENIAMMEYMQSKNFSLSMNFHGGAEVLNYPWDTFSARHVDDSWFQLISRAYADTVHTIDANYMDGFDNGITNGYDWYSISGGRQDYVTHFLHGREITLEISNTKLPDATELPAFWDKNYRSLLHYMEEASYGIHGLVTDTVGSPLQAKIMVLNHDFDSSFVRTQKGGVFYRYLKAGIYDIIVSANDHKSKTISDVNVDDFEATKLEVELEIDESVSVRNKISVDFTMYPNPTSSLITITNQQLKNRPITFRIFSLDGKMLWNKDGLLLDDSFEIDLTFLNSGIYLFLVENEDGVSIQKLIKND